MEIKLHNTLSNNKETFEPLNKGEVLMYNCGPTVYNFPSIGNMRSYIFANTLRRMFEYFGFKVHQVINITDVGHLVGDGDDGEDKVEKTAAKEGKTAEEIARFYENAFKKDLIDLNIDTQNTLFPRATEHIEEQIEIVKILEEKEIAYKTSDGMYFDTSKFPQYGKLGQINLEGLKEGARVEANNDKRNLTDFALWKFSLKNRLQEWDSPWGRGFPGWHIECSAMSRKYLGQPFDIHTGGIDHIPTHHNNEIAQSEGAFDLPLANIWMHNEFIKVDGQKMSKSLNNIYTITDLQTNKIHPLSYRYWLHTSHYHTPANFTWEAVLAAQNAFEKIIVNFTDLPESHGDDLAILAKFEEAISDDLNTSVAIALLQESKSKSVINKMDTVLGLNIEQLSKELFENIPSEILELKKERDTARENKDWHKSDGLRKEIESKGFIIEDDANESRIRKSLSYLA